MLMAPSEKNVWKKLPLKSHVNQVNDNKNDYKLAFGGKKIIRMVGSEKLPVLARLLDNPNYIDINNFYQRRLSWDKQAQSRLIESFLYNFPVPSITLYQRGHNSYIVVDGKQRMIAIRDFYDNKLQLTGLELNPELNGLTYNQIPEKFKENINRRVIDTVALLTDNTFNPEEVSQQNRIIFERLNRTSISEPLTNQEFRSYIYYGKLNQLLIDLASSSIFASSWEIPIDEPEKLATNQLHQTMGDAELILYFFALRHLQGYQGKLQDFLDIYMFRSMNFKNEDIQFLKKIFLKTINLAHDIYKEILFKPFDVKLNNWAEKADKAYYTAVLVGLSRHLHQIDILVERKLRIVEETKKMFEKDEFELFTDNTDTTTEILQRKIELFDDMLSKVIAG